MNLLVVERVRETIPAPEEPEVEMLAKPDWFEHRHRIVATEEAERQEMLREQREEAICEVVGAIVLVLVLAFLIV